MSETCITFGKFGSARVMVEDKEVQHYAMHVDPAKKEVSCWIASEAGKAFSVVWLDPDVEYLTAGTLYLDGYWSGSFRRGNKMPITFRTITISNSSCMPFLFSPLAVTDDDTFLESSSSCSVGEIKLVINRITAPVVEAHPVYNPPPPPQEVHERSKKAIAHRVKYGNEVPEIPQQRYQVTYHELLVTFIFKYRPLDMLQANQIAPRNPVPPRPSVRTLDIPSTPGTSSRKRKHSKVKEEYDSQGESEESRREKALLAEVRRCQAEVERIRKARQSKDGERPRKQIKEENETFFLPGEIIDLT